MESELRRLKTRAIVVIVLSFFIIGIFVSLILDIVDGIIILSTDWENKEINNSKTMWGLFTLLLLGPISTLVFASKSLKILKKEKAMINQQ